MGGCEIAAVRVFLGGRCFSPPGPASHGRAEALVRVGGFVGFCPSFFTLFLSVAKTGRRRLGESQQAQKERLRSDPKPRFMVAGAGFEPATFRL